MLYSMQEEQLELKNQAIHNQALLIWTYLGDQEVVKCLIDNGAQVNFRNVHGTSALMIATFYGHQPIVELLLSSGADINLQENRGITALMFAIVNSNWDMAKFLLNGKKANIAIKDHWGLNASNLVNMIRAEIQINLPMVYYPQFEIAIDSSLEMIILELKLLMLKYKDVPELNTLLLFHVNSRFAN